MLHVKKSEYEVFMILVFTCYSWTVTLYNLYLQKQLVCDFSYGTPAGTAFVPCTKQPRLFLFSALEEPYEKFKCAIKSSSMGVLCTAFPDVESLDQILGNAVHKNSTLESLIGQCDFS